MIDNMTPDMQGCGTNRTNLCHYVQHISFVLMSGP